MVDCQRFIKQGAIFMIWTSGDPGLQWSEYGLQDHISKGIIWIRAMLQISHNELHICYKRDILYYIYPHKNWSVQENDNLVQGLDLENCFFRTLTTLMCGIEGYSVPEVKYEYTNYIWFSSRKWSSCSGLEPPYTILFENLTQQCMVYRQTISRWVHDTWTIFL